MAPNYIQDLCVLVSTVSIRSALRSSGRPGSASYQTTSPETSILRCRSCGVEQFAAGHSHRINIVYFQKPAQDSSVFFIRFKHQLNFE